ncbi:glutathione peroxidase [Shimia sp. SDUM112013]|uniref:glutathione peroxidase n=1 Tax=Shimia sp. SDUM112013 TaxID=3136160 RepID=UPI0032EFE028
MKQIILTILIAFAWVLPAKAIELGVPFDNIDGGELRISQWAGQPVLVVNTASRCGYTNQYAQLQSLYDRYRDQGLVVLAVPSNDFRQELATEAEVKEFCEVQFGLDIPMTGITSVKGKDAHPFYRSLRSEVGFTPRWNFNKVLIAPDGQVAKTFGAKTKPLSRSITSEIENLLAGS